MSTAAPPDPATAVPDATVPDATVLDCHRRGWLAGAHAVLFSAPHWAGLMDRAAVLKRQPH